MASHNSSEKKVKELKVKDRNNLTQIHKIASELLALRNKAKSLLSNKGTITINDLLTREVCILNKLTPNKNPNNEGFDAIDGNGRKVEIKVRTLSDRGFHFTKKQLQIMDYTIIGLQC